MTQLVRELACPMCDGELDADGNALRCRACGRTYDASGGVARLVRADLPVDQRKTADAFGWEWREFAEIHPEYEAQFLDWIAPLGPDDFAGKLVVDAGCGTGRHSYFATEWGASVVALDLGPAVETASRVLEGRDALVVQGDLLRPPLKHERFDLVYSIGVVHHLPEPRAGIASLARLVRPGGTLFVWVYGHEGNAFVRTVVEPLRRIASRLPPRLVYAASVPPAAVLHAAAHLYRTFGARRLPLAEYVSSLADFSFRQNHSIVFDQLIAPTTHYVKRDELERWFADAGLEQLELTERNGNSWRARGVRPA